MPDDVLDRMNDAMEHRGPNDRGTHVSPGAAIGARRLSIIDVEGGHQPFSNEDGTIWAVQNGELYNHASIRDDLRRRGHRFASRCDTEILPHLYEEYGPMFPEQLRGMFGIAVWDQARQRGVIARDRLGIKPIYYAVCGDSLVFASELKSLLASGLVPTRPRLRGDRRVPDARVLPGAGDAAGRGEEARAGLHARDRERRGRAAALLELSAADARARRQRRGVERAPARRARGVGAACG